MDDRLFATLKANPDTIVVIHDEGEPAFLARTPTFGRTNEGLNSSLRVCA
jgi:hypothetical protein